MVLLLDNYDSFVHNVARYLRELGAEVDVVRSDAISVEEALERGPSHVVLSPGPCTPSEAGISVDLVQALGGETPVLGICLGHQAVAMAYGASLMSSPRPTHGRASRIFHRESGILDGLPSPFSAGRYHSLSVDPSSLPSSLRLVAWTREGEAMAIRHRTDPVWGVQFHPESILTEMGPLILEAFLESGMPVGSTPSPMAPGVSTLQSERTGELPVP